LTRLVLIIVAVSYLLGSIPFGYLLVWMFRGQDVRKTGSGNIGATNVARTGSKGLAIATLFLDAAKGYVAVKFAFWLASRQRLEGPIPTSLYDRAAGGLSSHAIFLLAALAALAAIMGHVFTVWLRFQGGKGVAAAAGSFVALAPRAMLVALVLFIVIVALTRYVSLGSILACVAFPLAVWWLGPAERTIRRLLAGTENRFR